MIERVACIGGGVIGAGWAARLLENGIDVALYDPSEHVQNSVQNVLSNAERAYSKLTMAQRPVAGTLTFCDTISEAVKDASWIIESVPERLDIKLSTYEQIEQYAADSAVIASSTSGIMPSDLQSRLRCPERLIVAHPFNPVYLLPLVEIVAGKDTRHDVIEQALSFYASLGMKPVHIKKEIDAFVADRLLEAVWRESLWLVKDGIATTEELDDIVRYGFGLRYAQMGVFETYRIAGGEQGMRHFLEQFGPCLSWPWTKLMDVPEFNDELVELIAGQSDLQSGHFSIRELERIRDDNLVAIQQALKANEWGAGLLLAEYEKKLFDQGARRSTQSDSLASQQDSGEAANDGINQSDEHGHRNRADQDDYSQPIQTTRRRIPPDWTDYNNHMNEARYLQCFGDATDAFMRLIGCDASYIDDGHSFFTAETHIRHLDEVRVNEVVSTSTQVLMAKGKKMHLFHCLYHQDGHLLATGEHMLLHVSLSSRSACEPLEPVRSALAAVAGMHAHLALPEGSGRAVGQAVKPSTS